MSQDSREEFNKQLALQKIANEKRQMMQERMLKKMEDTFFPANKITDRWRHITRTALMNTVPVMNKTAVKDFVSALKVVIDPKAKINMNQFQILANSLDTASPASLGLTTEEYIDAVNEIMATVEEWGQILEMINKEVTIEVEKEVSMKAAAMAEKGNGVLKPIIGEA